MAREGRVKATPELVLDAAVAIAEEKGWHAVTIRALADRLGYSSPLIYEHFRNKEEALSEAARRGFSMMERRLSGLAQDGTQEGLLSLCRAYVAFAQEQPALYAAMNGMNGIALPPEVLTEGAERMCAFGQGALAAWAEKEGFVLQNPAACADAVWCLLHGIASLAAARRLGAGVDSFVDFSVSAMLDGWRPRSS